MSHLSTKCTGVRHLSTKCTGVRRLNTKCTGILTQSVQIWVILVQSVSGCFHWCSMCVKYGIVIEVRAKPLFLFLCVTVPTKLIKMSLHAVNLLSWEWRSSHLTNCCVDAASLNASCSYMCLRLHAVKYVERTHGQRMQGRESTTLTRSGRQWLLMVAISHWQLVCLV